MKPITAEEIVVALQREYDDGWLFFTEVSSPGGKISSAFPSDFLFPQRFTKPVHGRRSIDALVIAHYSNKKATSIGFEIKVTRGDFLQELKSKKYRAWLPYTDMFYFACAKGAVKDLDEIPENIGLVEVSPYGTGYRRDYKKQATRRYLDRPPWALVAALINRTDSERRHYRWDFVQRKKAAQDLARFVEELLPDYAGLPDYQKSILKTAIEITTKWRELRWY